MPDMPKAYEPKKYEDKIYKQWQEDGFFRPEASLADKGKKNNYTIVLPPPNVTGTLHMGHAGMLAYEDILIRFRRMQGRRALWLPGTDHAAIATQAKVEKLLKEEGETRHSLGREKFLERVNRFAQDSHDTIVGQCKKMGASLDWSREAYTLDDTRNKAVNLVFKMMYEDGLIYRGERIVNWCPRCHSTLADDEVEYEEAGSKLYYFRYSEDFPITIATTRPETKLGDTAVAVNPKDERYQDLVGREYEVNFAGVPLKVKIIADRSVDREFGAGALGVTPAHSAVDWQMAEEHGLDIIKVINEDGNIREGFREYSGLAAREARKSIVEKLRQSGLMEKEEEIVNNLSVCYRCGAAVEPLPSLQWFIDVNKPLSGRRGRIDWEGKSIKDVCLETVKKGEIKIIPRRFEKNYYHWMENLRDWCISRQIWFGHQVPVWYKNNGQNGRQDIYVGLEAPEGKGWERDPDTLDTWFSSGMWTFSTLAHNPEEITVKDGMLSVDSEDFRAFHPTQVLETGYDILFFWVARMIIMTTYAIGDIPFSDVYLHGLVLDEEGKKMSKSKGNVIDPLDMIERYGTDATRLSLVIGSAPGHDLRLSEEKVAGFRNLVNKLWNVARFILQAAGKDGELPSGKAADIEAGNLNAPDQWILEKMAVLTKKVSKDLEKFRFSQAGERLREFTWNDLADWYLEASKFQKSPETPKILVILLKDLLKLWHPFIPFVTEAIWKEMGQDGKLIVAQWPESSAYAFDKKKDGQGAGFDLLKDIISAIRNARSENKVEPGRKIEAKISAGGHSKLVNANASLIKGMRTGIDKLDIVEGEDRIEDKGSIKVLAGGIAVYLIGAKDEAKEKERIARRRKELEALIKSLESKLSNQGFVQNAPEEVVKREQERLEKYSAELDNL